MKLKKIGTLALSLCFTGLLLQGSALAAPAAATVATEVQDEILWVAATVEQSEVGSLEIRIFTPKANGKKRSVFQRCTFNFQGTGEYRCGIDVAKGSIASKKSGRWISKVLVDGSVTDRTAFAL